MLPNNNSNADDASGGPRRDQYGPHLLVLVLTPAILDVRDFLAIGNLVQRIAPRIHVAIVTGRDHAGSVAKDLWHRPTLTVSLGGSLGCFSPPRGRILKSQQITKIDQFKRFRSLGIDTPLTERFDANTDCSEEKWGEFVVLKPLPLSVTSTGAGVRLTRTRRLEDLKLGSRLKDFIGSDAPVLVQTFIDTGVNATHWRVLTFLGRPLYSMKFWCPIPRPELTASDEEIEQAIIETKHPDLRRQFIMTQMRELTYEEDILVFAKRVFDAHPTVPLQGIDILREASTGRLFVLEINGGGNVWHFSSPRSQLGRKDGITKDERIQQFGAWRVAAEALIAATVRYAS